MEATGAYEEAKIMFLKAWKEAGNDFERFTAAHYVARYQDSVEEKLKWDEKALSYALKIKDKGVAINYPSLYLSIGKCFEELQDFRKANENYRVALSYVENLPNNPYGTMIESGIRKGIERVSEKLAQRL